MSKEIDVLSIRKALNWTRARLAEEAGVNVSTVCRWETSGVPERGTARSFLERLSRRAALRAGRTDEGAAA
jgi:transcriptional regulator with XRE-family HTH domain